VNTEGMVDAMMEDWKNARMGSGFQSKNHKPKTKNRFQLTNS